MLTSCVWVNSAVTLTLFQKRRRALNTSCPQKRSEGKEKRRRSSSGGGEGARKLSFLKEMKPK